MRTATKKAFVFLDTLYKDDITEASPDSVLYAIQTLFAWLAEKNYVVICDVFDNADVTRLAPGFLVAMIRSTSHKRDELYMCSWHRLLEKSKREFEKRGLDNVELWQGLEGIQK